MLNVTQKSLLCILILIICVGCSPKEEQPYISNEYVLEYEDDKCYMCFSGESKSEEANGFESRMKGLRFDSLEQLRDTIVNSKFTDSQLDIIRMDFADKDTKKIQICNPNKLFQAVYPDEFETWLFNWEGLSYMWGLSSEEQKDLLISYITKNTFEHYLKQMLSFFDEDQVSTQTEKGEDNNSEITYFTNTTEGLKRVFYELEQGVKKLYVKETYGLKESVDSVSGKKTLLYELEEIMILGKQNDEYFMVNLYGEKQRPSVEYLFEFGLREL